MKRRALIFFSCICFLGCVKRSGGASLSSEGPLDLPTATPPDSSFEGGADDPAVVEGEQIDEQNEVSVDPEVKVSFRIDNGLFALEHGVAVRWAGCDKNQYVVGGYESDVNCGKAFFHPDFSVHLEEHFYDCVLDAAASAGLNRPEKVFLRHVGTYNNRPSRGSNQLSMHAYARAIDIRNFNLYDQDDKLVTMSTHIRDYEDANATFYDGFRRCWSDSMPEACVPGEDEYKGSIGHTQSELGGNSLHADHIHLSYPLCAGS